MAKQPPPFDGDTYEPEHDGERLFKQLKAVRDLMLDGEWRTLAQISTATGAPQASVSARLRDLRKTKFGEYTVLRERGAPKSGLFRYKVLIAAELTGGK